MRLNLSSSLAPLLALLVAMVSIQSGAALGKGLFPAVGAQGVTSMRLGFAALTLLALRRPWRARLDARSGWPIVAYGVVLGTMNLLFYLSLRTLPLGIAVALEFTGPLGLALITSRSRFDLIWVACAVFGVLLLTPLGRDHANVDLGGALQALAAGVCWALYIVFGRKAGSGPGGAGPALAYGALIAAIGVVPIGVAHAGLRLLSWPVLGLGFGVALLSSVIPYSLEMMALRRLPTRTFGTLMSLEPAVGSVLGLVILGERLSPLQAVAIGVIMIASAGTILTHAATDAVDAPSTLFEGPPPPFHGGGSESVDHTKLS